MNNQLSIDGHGLDWFVDRHAAFGMKGAVSADGRHWTVLPEPLVMEGSDTQNVAYYDPALRKYVLYVRMWSVGPRSTQAPQDGERTWSRIGRRAIGRTETSDFRKFPLADTVLEPGPEMLPSDVLYTNCKITVPGAPDHHLMLPCLDVELIAL